MRSSNPSGGRRRWWPVASVALLLGATGCGGPDDTTAAPVPSASVKAYGSVVEAADAFLATLDEAEKKQVQLEFAQDKATAWSNLPCGATCRPGIELGDLDAGQIGAAKSVLKTALGTGTASGFARVEQIFLADDYLGALQASGGGGGPGGGMPSGGLSGGGPGGGMPSGGGPGGMPGGADSGYSSGTYFLAFLGKPSADGTWQLHFGGHHLAINLTYKAGKVAGVSPFFVGVEPTSWTASGSQSYAPLDDLRDAMLAMTSSLSEAEQAKAKLPQTYTDVLAGPGKDGQFPATKQGLAVSSLDRDQQKLVLAAIKPWVANADDATTAGLLKMYESQLDGTFISWSGTLALTTHADYVRIDGPSVWVEFVCQNGIVIQDKIHYHTVYRDHTRDYGGEFTFS